MVISSTGSGRDSEVLSQEKFESQEKSKSKEKSKSQEKSKSREKSKSQKSRIRRTYNKCLG